MNHRIRSILKTSLALEDADAMSLSAASSIHTVGKWDSLGHVRLVLALEAEFTVTIPNEDAVRLISVRHIEEYLASRRVDL